MWYGCRGCLWVLTSQKAKGVSYFIKVRQRRRLHNFTCLNSRGKLTSACEPIIPLARVSTESGFTMHRYPHACSDCDQI